MCSAFSKSRKCSLCGILQCSKKAQTGNTLGEIGMKYKSTSPDESLPIADLAKPSANATISSGVLAAPCSFAASAICLKLRVVDIFNAYFAPHAGGIG